MIPKSLQNHIRGWFPKDPYLRNGDCEVNKLSQVQNRKLDEYEDKPVIKRWMKAFVILGGVGYLVFYFVTPIFQATVLGFSIWVAVMAFLVFLDYLVIKDLLKKQRTVEDLH